MQKLLICLLALFEVTEDKKYRAAKKIFVTKPSDVQMMQFLLEDYYKLIFTKPQKNSDGTLSKTIKNTKRMQREAAKANKTIGASTKAQLRKYSQKKAAVKKQKTKNKKAYADEQYKLRKRKRMQKHRER